jgi:tetratricopeptide (TPR) repeat protein
MKTLSKIGKIFIHIIKRTNWKEVLISNNRLAKILLVVFVIILLMQMNRDQTNKDDLFERAKHESSYNKNMDEAMKLYAEAISKEENDNEFDANVYAQIAYDNYFYSHNYKEVIKNYWLAHYLYKNIANNYEFHEYLGASYYEINNIEKAIYHLNKSVEMNKASNHDRLSWYSYYILSCIYEKKGDSALSKKYLSLSDKYQPQSSSVDTQSQFESWLLRNTSVTEVHFESVSRATKTCH